MAIQASAPPLLHAYNTLDDLRLPSVPASSFLAQSPPQLPTMEPLPNMSVLTNALDAPHHHLSRPVSSQHRHDLKPLQLPRIHDMIPHELSSPTDATSTASHDTLPRRRDTSASIQSAEDRMAAEALCGLGQVDSNTSHTSRTSHESSTRYDPLEEERQRHSQDEPEPLLQLLTSSHPWIGGTINNSLSAYSSTKQNSPRIIQYGADFVERNIGSPVVSTVGSVGRRTGVEGSLRRFLDARRPSETEQIDPQILSQDGSAKRRRVAAGEDTQMDIDSEHDPEAHRKISDQSSVDTLPLYDENRSPAYEESPVTETPTPRLAHLHFRPTANRSWSTQLMIHTSGLGAALNEASLRSLKYCLSILRAANKHVRDLMETLRRLLSDFERVPHSPRHLENGIYTSNRTQSDTSHVENGASGPMDIDPMLDGASHHDSHSSSAETIAKRIQTLNDEIWQTLKNVVTNVSRYTGGALPERASGFVKWQLMSVPGRWQRAVSHSQSPTTNNTSSSVTSPQQPVPTPMPTGSGRDDGDTVGNAHRMLAFAIEGIDMMEQVGGVVDSTIVSAEAWLERMGRQPRSTEDGDGDGVAPDEQRLHSVNGGAGSSQEDELMSYDGSTTPRPPLQQR